MGQDVTLPADLPWTCIFISPPKVAKLGWSINLEYFRPSLQTMDRGVVNDYYAKDDSNPFAPKLVRNEIDK